MNEREIFQAAIEFGNPRDRADYLDQACANQPELRSTLEALLQHHEEAGSFLEQPPAEFEKTRMLEEQATNEPRFSQSASRENLLSDDMLSSFLTPSETPGVMGTLGQYEVLEKIGQGGMGVVLKAKDTKLHRIVAIKLLAPELASNPMARKRFLREAQAAAAVTHDHVVRIYAVNDSPKIPMLVMECIDGQSLQQKIDRTGALETREILRIGLQAALGLAAAHKQGLVHRDIKPANILLENGIERVKLTDFGLARAVDDVGMTQTGQITGTPQYMSPEQAQGDLVDSRSDLFSLGSVLYAMCTGRAAFRADSTVAVLRRVCDDQPRPIQEVNPDIPDWLAEIVEQLLEKDPEQRFQSAEEVAELLSDSLAQVQQIGSNHDLPSYAKQQAQPDSPRRDRFVFPWAILAGLLLVGALLGITEATGVTRFAATMIRVATGEGILMVEVDDPNVSVAIEGEDLVITGAGPNEVRLKPGEYRVTATKAGQPVQQELITITRNGKQIVRIALEGGKPPKEELLSAKLQQELELALRAGRGELSEAELKSLKAGGHKLPDLLEMPVGQRILELLAELPEKTHQDLIQAGYLKWPYAGLSPTHRDSFAGIIELFFKQAQEMGFGGKKSPLENTRAILQRADVGFTVIDFPGSQQAITFYLLMPNSPLPLAMPIVPSDPRDWENLDMGEDQYDQLRKIKRKPNSRYPIPVSESLLRLPSKISLLKQSRLIVKGGLRPVWTPGGRELMYAQQNDAPIEVYDLVSGITRRFLSPADLAPNPSEPMSLVDAAISPDGKNVAVVLRPLGKGNEVYLQEEIWVIRFEEEPPRRIVEGGYPSFGKDSDLLYFQDRKRSMLCSIRLDDPKAKPKDVLACPAWYPIVSPDGQWVASSEKNRLDIASLETGEVVASWKCPVIANGMLMSWSPDSKKLGLCPYEGQNRLGFWCYDVERQAAVQFSDDPIGEVAWSPNGLQLAFTLHKGPPEIYLINADQLPKHP